MGRIIPTSYLKPEDFPLTIKAMKEGTDEVVWEVTVTEPGPVEIPALAQEIGCPVDVETEYADGTVFRTTANDDTMKFEWWTK